jgi:hypothetical protein
MPRHPADPVDYLGADSGGKVLEIPLLGRLAQCLDSLSRIPAGLVCLACCFTSLTSHSCHSHPPPAIAGQGLRGNLSFAPRGSSGAGRSRPHDRGRPRFRNLSDCYSGQDFPWPIEVLAMEQKLAGGLTAYLLRLFLPRRLVWEFLCIPSVSHTLPTFRLVSLTAAGHPAPCALLLPCSWTEPRLTSRCELGVLDRLRDINPGSYPPRCAC